MKHTRHKTRQSRRLAAFNQPGAIRRRTAARQDAIAAGPEPAYPLWRPGDPGYTITIQSASGSVVIYADVPPTTGRRRPRSECWAVRVDDIAHGVLGATDIGRLVAHEIRPRPSLAMLASIQNGYSARDEADAAAA